MSNIYSLTGQTSGLPVFSYGYYVWDIILDNGERLKLVEHEAIYSSW